MIQTTENMVGGWRWTFPVVARNAAGRLERGTIHELLADLDKAEMAEEVLDGHSQAENVMPFMAERRPDLFRRYRTK